MRCCPRLLVAVFVVALAMVGFAATGRAASIVVDTTPGPDFHAYSDAHAPYAQTFLAQGSQLVSFGFDLVGTSGDFVIQGMVFATTSDAPSGSPLFTSAPLAVGARGVYSFDAAGLALTVGDTYAVAFDVLSGASAGGDGWYAYNSGVQPGSGFFGFGSNPSTDVGIDFAVRIEMVAVPEPGSVALLGLGLVGLALQRRRPSLWRRDSDPHAGPRRA